jgi:hypothetical protein
MQADYGLGHKAHLLFAGALAFVFASTAAMADEINIPANTRIYVELDQDVSGKKKHTKEGQTVRASVWRDVRVNGVTVIKSGAPVLVRVDSIKNAKIAGVKGKMTLGAYETTLANGNPVQLTGGYNKKGKGRIALSATLTAFLCWPCIFIKGKAANLSRGTVFDAYTDQSAIYYTLSTGQAANRVDLSGVLGNGLTVEVLYDELEGVEKPEIFAFAISAPLENSGRFDIDRINGVAVDPISVSVVSNGTDGDRESFRGEVAIKALGKEFKKGINTFEMATLSHGQRLAKEVVLDVQF